MDASQLAHGPTAWRDRLAGRIPFDACAAEAAVRRAYRASALPEPIQVLFVKGPREAAQAIAFLESPPRKLRRMIVAALGLGAAAWAFLSLAINGGTFGGQSPATAAMLSAVLAGFALALGAAPQLPVPADLAARQHGGKVIFLGATFFVALAGCTFALQRLAGLPIDPVGRGAALALAASVGTLPGAFLWLRMRLAYAHLPRVLLELSPAVPVARQLARGRREAWASFRRPAIGPDRSLLHAYRSAYWEAFAQRRAHRMDFNIAAGVSWDMDVETFGGIPPHLDGIEPMSRAAAVGGVGATGSAVIFADLAFHVDRLYPFATVAVAVRPATTVVLDAEGRPHAEDGPALAWADGTCVYAWRGRVVPSDVLASGAPVTRSRINREMDPDRRLVLIERYGLGRYLLEAGGTEIQHDACGRLYRLTQPVGEPILAVRVVNHTPEPDGSVREFWLRVPPTMTTARQAVAWTFDLPAERYDPIAQS